MSLPSNAHLYLKPVFNQALIDQYKPMMIKFINSVYGWNTSDVCYEHEDMVQECTMHLWEAVQKFEEGKGMKFQNFLFMVLKSRLGNFRTKISKSNFKTSNFSSIPGGWAITGAEVDDESTVNFSSKYEVSFLMEEVQNQILDATLAFNRMSEERQQVYRDHFILGKTVSEIVKESEGSIKSHQVRRQMKSLEKIHTTLVEGQL